MIVGHGARALIERGFQETGDPIEHDRLNDLVARFIDYYAAHIADASAPFPGTIEMLDSLAAGGARLAILTNKYEALTLQLLRTLELEQRFATIVGADTLATRKPDAQSFIETVRRAGGTLRRSLMVGDSPTDVATARAAKVPIVAVTFGYTPVPPIEFGADALVERFDQLEAVLGGLLPDA